MFTWISDVSYSQEEKAATGEIMIMANKENKNVSPIYWWCNSEGLYVT